MYDCKMYLFPGKVLELVSVNETSLRGFHAQVLKMLSGPPQLGIQRDVGLVFQRIHSCQASPSVNHIGRLSHKQAPQTLSKAKSKSHEWMAVPFAEYAWTAVISGRRELRVSKTCA